MYALPLLDRLESEIKKIVELIKLIVEIDPDYN